MTQQALGIAAPGKRARSGTKRQIAATQQFGCFRTKADIFPSPFHNFSFCESDKG
jgi:hypothetical protein